MTDANSRLYCVIGNPIRHSMSPQIHNAAFEHCGINAVYVAFEVAEVADAIRGIRALGIAGASVTIPHKLAVMPFLDEIADVAKMIGAVNTIVNENGRLLGLNTDGAGAVKALKDASVKLEGGKIAMIGSGGAARAVGFALAASEKIASMTILGVVPEETSKLAKEISEKTGVPAASLHLADNKNEAQKKVSEADVVINTSPVGMSPKDDETPIPAEWVSSNSTVFDVVYNPLETRLIREIAAKGRRTISGVEMFVNQAVLQFERWTGKKAPIALMRKIVIENLRAK